MVVKLSDLMTPLYFEKLLKIQKYFVYVSYFCMYHTGIETVRFHIFNLPHLK